MKIAASVNLAKSKQLFILKELLILIRAHVNLRKESYLAILIFLLRRNFLKEK